MPAAVPLIGLGFGMLLTATGLALRNDLWRKAAGLYRATQVVGWLAGVLLATTALVLWIADHGQHTVVLQLALMAALSAPEIGRRRGVEMLPALALAGGGLALALGLRQTEAHASSLTPTRLALVICGGLGARVLGEALSVLVNPNAPPRRALDAAYLLLTLLVGGAALANLWQRGSAWEGIGGLAGTWLVWSAAWLSPRRRARLRAGLAIVAAALLILVALR